MTGKELASLINSIDDLKTRIIDEFEKRLKELEEIAKEKGVTEFGWVDGDIEDSDTAGWEQNYNTYTIGFFEEGDGIISPVHHALNCGNPCEGYTFRIENGKVYFTRLYDLNEEEYYYDVAAKFDVYNPQHTILFPHIIRIAENDLGL